MNLQLWTTYYDPEPTGIAPVSTALARGLTELGWHVEVVTAHPHYPAPLWGRPRRPRIEHRDGIRIARVPLWIGRETAAARIRQELSFAAALLALSPTFGEPLLAKPDLIVAASPSFPALLPAMLNARTRRTPLVLWLHDILRRARHQQDSSMNAAWFSDSREASSVPLIGNLGESWSYRVRFVRTSSARAYRQTRST